MHKRILIAIGLLFVSQVQASVEKRCAGAESGTEQCLYFFKGYLYGLADTTTPTKAREEGSETFLERALRTRLGVQNAERTTNDASLPYCLPDQVSLSAIARELQDTFTEDARKWSEEEDPILSALQTLYPC